MFRWFRRKRGYSYHVTCAYINKAGGLSFSDRSVQVTEKMNHNNNSIAVIKDIFEKEHGVSEIVIISIVKL